MLEWAFVHNHLSELEESLCILDTAYVAKDYDQSSSVLEHQFSEFLGSGMLLFISVSWMSDNNLPNAFILLDSHCTYVLPLCSAPQEKKIYFTAKVSLCRWEGVNHREPDV